MGGEKDIKIVLILFYDFFEHTHIARVKGFMFT